MVFVQTETGCPLPVFNERFRSIQYVTHMTFLISKFLENFMLYTYLCIIVIIYCWMKASPTLFHSYLFCAIFMRLNTHIFLISNIRSLLFTLLHYLGYYFSIFLPTFPQFFYPHHSAITI